MSFTFPKDFLWGTATAAHQIEGNNVNSDWWAWEHRDRSKEPTWKANLPLEPSLIACDSYNRYEEDFDLCVKLNNNAVRFGIEWARIEPEEGKFDQNEIEHYRKVLKAAKDRQLQTFVTLHHFTSPAWLAKMGGWLNPKVIELFARYSRKCAEEFGSLVDFWTTINEPQVYTLSSYFYGKWPPQFRNPFKVLKVQQNQIRAHIKAYDAIKTVGDYKVGIVKNISWFVDSWPLNKIFYYFGATDMLNKLRSKLDYIGVNYYFTQTHNFRWLLHMFSLQSIFSLDKFAKFPFSDLKWSLNPTGIEKILLDLKKYNLPIYITENGLADHTDKYRVWYINQILRHCAKALNAGVPLKGYFHWSLIDNYEWAEGFWPRFGLVGIDRENGLKRIPRPSFYFYANICRTGRIN